MTTATESVTFDGGPSLRGRCIEWALEALRGMSPNETSIIAVAKALEKYVKGEQETAK